jgi:hypothetical protein
MHTKKVNVLSLGNSDFNSSLVEIKGFLNFNLEILDELKKNIRYEEYDLLLVHQDYLEKKEANFLKNLKILKLLIYNKKKKLEMKYFNEKILLPLRIEDINKLILDSVVKKNFNINSRIKIKNFILDKNEKKLIKDKNHIILTEKEIQLLELFYNSKEIVSKTFILKYVWEYSKEADTHTVETHIYRLRKKIKEKFNDDKFIINNQKGYCI